MNVIQLADKCGFKLLNCNNEPNEITGVYCGDLLSIVMSKAYKGCAWVTVMSNINSVAVAVLSEAACIIIAEPTYVDENTLEKAKDQNVAILQSDMPVFETALKIHEALKSC